MKSNLQKKSQKNLSPQRERFFYLGRLERYQNLFESTLATKKAKEKSKLESEIQKIYEKKLAEAGLKNTSPGSTNTQDLEPGLNSDNIPEITLSEADLKNISVNLNTDSTTNNNSQNTATSSVVPSHLKKVFFEAFRRYQNNLSSFKSEVDRLTEQKKENLLREQLHRKGIPASPVKTKEVEDLLNDRDRTYRDNKKAIQELKRKIIAARLKINRSTTPEKEKSLLRVGIEQGEIKIRSYEKYILNAETKLEKYKSDLKNWHAKYDTFIKAEEKSVELVYGKVSYSKYLTGYFNAGAKILSDRKAKNEKIRKEKNKYVPTPQDKIKLAEIYEEAKTEAYSKQVVEKFISPTNKTEKSTNILEQKEDEAIAEELKKEKNINDVISNYPEAFYLGGKTYSKKEDWGHATIEMKNIRNKVEEFSKSLGVRPEITALVLHGENGEAYYNGKQIKNTFKLSELFHGKSKTFQSLEDKLSSVIDKVPVDTNFTYGISNLRTSSRKYLKKSLNKKELEVYNLIKNNSKTVKDIFLTIKQVKLNIERSKLDMTKIKNIAMIAVMHNTGYFTNPYTTTKESWLKDSTNKHIIDRFGYNKAFESVISKINRHKNSLSLHVEGRVPLKFLNYPK